MTASWFAAIGRPSGCAAVTHARRAHRCIPLTWLTERAAAPAHNRRNE